MKPQKCSGGIRQQGLTYVEVLLSVALLAACLVPAMQAVRDNNSALAAINPVLTDIDCVKQSLEKTLLIPYDTLLTMAGSTPPQNGVFFNPSYSMEPDPSYPVCTKKRDVYILRYNPTLSDPFSSASDDMLYIRAEIAGGEFFSSLAVKQ